MSEKITRLLREKLDDMTVYKDQKSSLFNGFALPVFLRDWILRKFSEDDGSIDREAVTNFINKNVPNQEGWIKLKASIVKDCAQAKIIAKIRLFVNIKDQEVSFELPDYGLKSTETIIQDNVWDDCKEALLAQGEETWGVIDLGYMPPYTGPKGKKMSGKIKLLTFKNFSPYAIDMDYYKDVRKSFSTQEWLDVLIGAIDYNGDAIKESEKCTMLQRLLPFVENNLNLIELAPKGTGKTYMFAQLSRYGRLISGSSVTRAAMFYDRNKKQNGFIVGTDFVTIDEAKLVNFGNKESANELRGTMQDYMERGKCNLNGQEVRSNAGIIFAGNIDADQMDENKNMFSELPQLFQESALLDRVHGFIKGWDVPRLKDNMRMVGWALNCEYFTSVLHNLRSDASYRRIVDEVVTYDGTADLRHTEAVKRLTTAFLKLIFPNVRQKEDIDIEEFKKYCLESAVKMRSIIQKQLAILDPKLYKNTNIAAFEVEL